MSDAGLGRVSAIDRLRGLVILLMTVDHADAVFNSGHLMTDGVSWDFGQELAAGSFLTRWLTHLCAPTFLFLAGVSVVLSSSRAIGRGASAVGVDRHLAARGVVLILLDVVYMTFAFGVWWMFSPSRFVLVQVLYAIGVGLVLSPVLRRLASDVLCVLAGVIVAVNEWVAPANAMDFSARPPEAPDMWLSLSMTGGMHYGVVERFGVLVMYPALPWVAVMMLGVVFGRVLAKHGARKAARVALVGGLVGLAVFASLRWANGWGNTGLVRVDGSWQQWLRCSKYPPGVTFLGLELGLMGLLLALMLRLDVWRGERAAMRDPMLLVGKTSLLYYLLHVPLLVGSAALIWWVRHRGEDVLNFAPEFGLGATWIAAGVCAAVLLPVCVWYGGYKRRHRNVVTRYL